MERQGSLRLHDDDEIISDETLETMLDALDGTADDTKVAELLQAMNENRIISREEAEQIMEIEGPNRVIKCGLPPHVRPSDPENTTDPEECVSRLLKDDPTLVEVNLNNMKRTPIPVIQRMLMALKTNTHLKRLMLANTALTDTGAEPILEALEHNTTLELLNIETNFLSGDFLAKLFNAALVNQTVREIKAVNQSPTFSTESEMEIMTAVNRNRGLIKVSVNLRHPEAKNKVEQACLRNGEIRRQQRRLEQLQKQREAEDAKQEQDHVTENHVDKPKPQAKPAPVTKPEASTTPKKDLVKKPLEKPATSPVKKEQNATETKPEKKTLEKVPEKKPVEPEKKTAEKEKPAPKREWGKKVEEKPTPVEAKAKSPVPPPAPKVEPPKEEPPAPTVVPEKPKPTLALAAKEAAAKAASRGFGTSGSPDVTPKKKISIGEKSKLFEPPPSPGPMETPAQIAAKTRPASLNIGASKDVPTSKGLGAATFGAAAAPKPATPSKTEPPKGGRRGSGTIKPPTPATPTPKTESPTKAPWTPIKPPSQTVAGSKSSDVKSKADSMSSSITEKNKPVTYGYGGVMKKRDTTK